MCRSSLCAFLLAGLLSSAASISFATATPDLGKDDAALLQHIKANDYVFQRVLEQCHGETIHRSNRKGLHYFTYSATCAIRAHYEDDCPSYGVTATGTIDTPQSATVRDIQLVLKCYA
jgi:hypothetical protein